MRPSLSVGAALHARPPIGYGLAVVKSQEISRPCYVGGVRYSVHFYPPSRRVVVIEFPERLTPDAIERMRTPLATGSVKDNVLVWETNGIGAVADAAAAWTVAYTIENDQLFFFVDETGGESLTDPKFPVFGLGGCVVRAEDYHEIIAGPWSLMKMHHFGGLRARLHAAELRDPTAEQLAALASFFKEGRFHRVAAIVKKSTKLGAGVASVCEAAATMLMRNLGAVVNRVPSTGVTTVFESSERGDAFAKAFFPTVGAQAGPKPFPLRWAIAPKSTGQSGAGLEVADFIVQAGGAKVRNHEAGNRSPRKDFTCIFRDVDESLVEFGELDSLSLARVPGGTVNRILLNPPEVVERAKSK